MVVILSIQEDIDRMEGRESYLPAEGIATLKHYYDKIYHYLGSEIEFKRWESGAIREDLDSFLLYRDAYKTVRSQLGALEFSLKRYHKITDIGEDFRKNEIPSSVYKQMKEDLQGSLKRINEAIYPPKLPILDTTLIETVNDEFDDLFSTRKISDIIVLTRCLFENIRDLQQGLSFAITYPDGWERIEPETYIEDCQKLLAFVKKESLVSFHYQDGFFNYLKGHWIKC